MHECLFPDTKQKSLRRPLQIKGHMHENTHTHTQRSKVVLPAVVAQDIKEADLW